MTSSIRKFWQRLEGSVHPEDKPLFSAHHHTFNLDFPPPAFIGDVDNAPIVVLMANGGYAAHTPSEFQEPSDYEEHRNWLRASENGPPRRFAAYYTQHRLFPWILAGKAVIVNAVAYRSPKISQEPHNRHLAKLLPSWRVHQKWLREEVLPAVKTGRRRLVAHRYGLWSLSRSESGVDYSPNPASPYLSREITTSLESWLRQRIEQE